MSFTVKANYSFWKHPIQWFKEMRLRRLLGKIINYQWNHGDLEKKVTDATTHSLVYGHRAIPNEDWTACWECGKPLTPSP